MGIPNSAEERKGDKIKERILSKLRNSRKWNHNILDRGEAIFILQRLSTFFFPSELEIKNYVPHICSS